MSRPTVTLVTFELPECDEGPQDKQKMKRNASNKKVRKKKVKRNCESALFLEPKITSSLCDAVGSEDEKQTRTLTNGKDRHHN